MAIVASCSKQKAEKLFSGCRGSQPLKSEQDVLTKWTHCCKTRLQRRNDTQVTHCGIRHISIPAVQKRILYTKIKPMRDFIHIITRTTIGGINEIHIIQRIARQAILLKETAIISFEIAPLSNHSKVALLRAIETPIGCPRHRIKMHLKSKPLHHCHYPEAHANIYSPLASQTASRSYTANCLPYPSSKA